MFLLLQEKREDTDNWTDFYGKINLVSYVLTLIWVGRKGDFTPLLVFP